MISFLPLIVLPFLLLNVQTVDKDQTNFSVDLTNAIKKFEEKQTKCLAAVVYHEARGEPLKGKIAVAQVVLNRKRSKWYPNTICKVAFQKAQFTGLKEIKYNDDTYKIAKQAIEGKFKGKMHGATHYHALEVNPTWASWDKLKKVSQIGNHIFYRMTV